MPPTEATILERLLDAEHIDLPPEVARYFLSLDFPPAERGRIEELTAKERSGDLTPAERTELESYRHVSQMLTRVRQRARRVVEPTEPAQAVPEGIRRSQEAFWRDLPELLKYKRNHGKWVCYHGDTRLGIAPDDVPLIQECLRRGIPDEAYYLAVIHDRDLPPWEPEEVEPLGPWHFADHPPLS
jgi:hypothetical protein